jgi:DNA-directed RNA polymerase subunit RPC12/RpoP
MKHVIPEGDLKITKLEELDQTVYRCGYCRTVVLPLQVATKGCCGECGSRMLRIATMLSDDEIAKAKAEGYLFTSDRWYEGPFRGFEKEDAENPAVDKAVL